MLEQSLKEQIELSRAKMAGGTSRTDALILGHLGSCTGRSGDGMGTIRQEMRLKEEGQWRQNLRVS